MLRIECVCTIFDERKRAMILDSSKMYLKGTSFFVKEDRTPQEQERRSKHIHLGKQIKMHSKQRPMGL